MICLGGTLDCSFLRTTILAIPKALISGGLAGDSELTYSLVAMPVENLIM